MKQLISMVSQFSNLTHHWNYDYVYVSVIFDDGVMEPAASPLPNIPEVSELSTSDNTRGCCAGDGIVDGVKFVAGLAIINDLLLLSFKNSLMERYSC